MISIQDELLWSEIETWCRCLFSDCEIQPGSIIHLGDIIMFRFTRTLSTFESYLVSHDRELWFSLWQQEAPELIDRLSVIVCHNVKVKVLDAAVDLCPDGQSVILLYCDSSVNRESGLARLGPFRHMIEALAAQLCTELLGKGPSSIRVLAKGGILLVNCTSDDVITSQFQQYDDAARVATRVYCSNAVSRMMNEFKTPFEGMFGVRIKCHFLTVSVRRGHLVLVIVFEESIHDLWRLLSGYEMAKDNWFALLSAH